MLSEQLGCYVSPKDGECCETYRNTVCTIIRWFLDPSTPLRSAQDDIIDVMLRMTYILMRN